MDAEPGSQPWARYFFLRAIECRRRTNADVKSLLRILDKLERHKAWRPLGYSFSDELWGAIGLDVADVERLRAAKPDELIRNALNPPGVKRHDITATNGRSDTMAYGQTLRYLTARLARDRPDIKAKLDAGEFASVRAAALAAGIVERTFECPTDPVKAARRIKRHFQGEILELLIRGLTTDDR